MVATRFRVMNDTRDVVLASQAGEATNPIRRGIGLIGKKSLGSGEGLIIRPCNSVVSFFMRFPIDVIFVGSQGEVLHVLDTMVPWRTSKIVRGSKFVVELPAGTARDTGTQVGDHITISPVTE